MTEQIGKVTLDYSKYPGEDLYSDGQVEEELLHIARDLSPAEYDKVIGESKNWPILYHFSFLRENIVEWIPMEKTAKVLEVGSGCGAITGALARKAGSVTCVELSKKRSMINAERHSGCDNITIHVGNFKDIEPDLPDDFDYICLIGVFEYAQSYIGGETPFEDFLNILKPHLKEGGHLVIAIENKYGLKYFAGCREDHLDSYFSGIENYPQGGGVRTFSRKGLEKIFEKCGVEEYHFYYPYPDYKFMHTLYSDAYQPQKGELTDNMRNFDADRLVLFDESSAFDGMAEDGLFSVFSNSYLVMTGEAPEIQYVKYSNDRAPEYAVKTEIRKKADGERIVRKYPQTESAKEHVRGMAVAYDKLLERYRGGNLEINKCKLVERNSFYAEFEFVEGKSLLELMRQCLDRDDNEGFMRYFREYRDRIGYHSDYPVSDFDLIFSNIFVDGDKWTLIDYEWTFGKTIKVEELAFRAVYYMILDDARSGRLDLDQILKELDITEEEAHDYWEQEMDFQRFVAGKRMTLKQMRDLIGCRLMEPLNWIDHYQDSGNVNRVQIYEDYGEGCSEEHSYFVREAYLGENLIELNLNVSGDVKMLRIDPALDCCIVKIRELLFNGKRVPLKKRKMLLVNGRFLRPVDKEAESYCPDIVFPTTDPNINVNLAKLKRESENILYAKMEIVRIPLQMAADIAETARKRL